MAVMEGIEKRIEQPQSLSGLFQSVVQEARSGIISEKINR